MNCPMCQLPAKYQQPDPDNATKSKCTGCGTKFFNRDLVFK